LQSQNFLFAIALKIYVSVFKFFEKLELLVWERFRPICTYLMIALAPKIVISITAMGLFRPYIVNIFHYLALQYAFTSCIHRYILKNILIWS